MAPNAKAVWRGAVVATALALLGLMLTTRLSMVDPYAPFFDSYGPASNGAALVQCSITLFATARLMSDANVWFLVGIAGALVTASVAVGVTMPLDEPKDVLRIYVGQHVPVPLLGWSLLAWVLTKSPGNETSENGWWLCGVASFAAGLLLHLVLPLGYPQVLLAKVALSILLPSTCLIQVARGFEGRWRTFVRVTSAVGAAALVATATIR